MELNYTHFRFGVGCHDKNGFWYSENLMTFNNPKHLQKQWRKWEELQGDLERDPEDPREMLIDQYDDKTGDYHKTIVIPSKHADDIQKQIFGDQYDELKFDIFSVSPETITDLKEKLKDSGIEC